MKPTHKWNPTEGRYDPIVADSMTAHAVNYWPGVKFLEPKEDILVSVVTERLVTDETGIAHHAVYRRDTNFSGCLSEALKLFAWG